MLNSNVVNVGLASMGILKGNGILRTFAIGSSVAIFLHDEKNQVSGCVHSFLPTSKNIKANANIYKFIDLSILKLTKEMILNGAKQETIVAKIVGGAIMFDFEPSQNLIQSGQRNIFATKNILKKLNINLIAESVGGNLGKTAFFNSKDGLIIIKSIHNKIYTI